MRIVLSAVVLGALSFAALPVAAEEVRFEGFYTFTETTNCQDTNAGERGLSRYYPSNLGDNANFTQLATVDRSFAAAYRRDGGRFTAEFRATTLITIGFGSSVRPNGARVRILTQEPTPLTETTAFLSVTGEIESPAGDPGAGDKPCVAAFSASYVRR